MLNISTRDLAIELADRLNDIMPQGFVVHVQGAALAVMHDERIVGIFDALAIMESVEAIKRPRENLETALRATLSGVQDHIAETTTEPWPGSGAAQPNPDVRVDGDRVQLWFGSEEDPMSRCGRSTWLEGGVPLNAISCRMMTARDTAATVLLVRRVVGAVLLVLLASACAIQGSPGPSTSPTSSGARPSGSVELPPRPREVRLDGVDPCSLLTEQQRAELGLDGRPAFSEAPVGLYKGAEVPLCTVRGFEPRAVTVGVSLVTSVGVERFTSGELAAELRPIGVQGFPSLVVTPTRFTEYCTVIVDVAQGQLLDVQFATGGRQPPIPQPQLCQDAEIVAREVMATLLDR